MDCSDRKDDQCGGQEPRESPGASICLLGNPAQRTHISRLVSQWSGLDNFRNNGRHGYLM